MNPPYQRSLADDTNTIWTLAFSCARFGLWNDILSEPLYDDPDLYPTGCAAAHYARGIAFASLGRVAEAEVEQVGQANCPKSLRIGTKDAVFAAAPFCWSDASQPGLSACKA